MRIALRPFGRGLRDTLDHLLPFLGLSLSWWLGFFLVVSAPAATLALFRATDPRALDDDLRPSGRELRSLVRRWLGPGWALAAVVAVPALVLLYNLATYGDSSGVARVLVPLWILFLLLVLMAGGVACSLVAVHGYPVSAAVRRATLLTLAHAPAMLLLAAVIWVLVAVGGLLAVPAVTFLPPLVAVTFNHLTYGLLGIPVADPLEPTPERFAEGRSEPGPYATN